MSARLLVVRKAPPTPWSARARIKIASFGAAPASAEAAAKATTPAVKGFRRPSRSPVAPPAAGGLAPPQGGHTPRMRGGASVGPAAALVWAAAEPLLRRAFGTEYTDSRLVGRLGTTGRLRPLAGPALPTPN